METCYFESNCSSKTDNCMKICHLYLQMDDMFERSYVPDVRRYFKLMSPQVKKDASVFKRLGEIKANIREFVEAGKNLYIFSENYGNGKTTWALRILFTYFHSWWLTNCLTCRGVLVSVPEILFRFKTEKYEDSFKQYVHDIETCDLVVWDDISDVDLLDGDACDFLTMLINKRVQSFKSNIYTSHLTKDDLMEESSPQIAHRIFTRCELIEIHADTFEEK